MHIAPCPFCGRTHVEVVEADELASIKPACLSCGASGPTVRRVLHEPVSSVTSLQNAILAWNVRVT